MSEKSKDSGLVNQWFGSEGEEGREKQKIRIKYRQRVKIKKRPKAYKLTRYWKRNRKNLFAYIVLIILLGATMFMIVQVAKQQLEMNQHKTRQRL